MKSESKKLFQRTLLFVISSLINFSAHAGHESHGSDSNVESLAWYLGAGKTIHYCYQASEAFLGNVGHAMLRASVEGAFAKWTRYVEEKEIDSYRIPEDSKDSLTFSKRLSWTGRVCDGSEDLVVYFGIRNEQIDQARNRFDDPVAFTFIPRYQTASLWQRGFIWVANPGEIAISESGRTIGVNWDRSGELENVLLHEWGHIFGNGHIQGTVMDSRLKEILLAARQPGGSLRAPTIDGQKELYSFPDWRRRRYVGKLNPIRENERLRFLDMVGREPVGEVTVEVTLIKPQVDGESSSSTIKISDAAGSRTFALEVLFNSPTFFVGEEVFRRKMANGDVFFNRHSAISYRGFLRFERPDRSLMIPISIESNTSPGNETTAGTARQMELRAQPVQIFVVGLSEDRPRELLFLGEHAE